LAGSINAQAVSGVLYGDWIQNLSLQQFLSLAEVVVGAQLENAALVIGIIGRWIHANRPLDSELRDFAWRCLEVGPIITQNNANEFDKVASLLAQSEADRGFRLLEKLLRVPHDKHGWNPIKRYGVAENRFWNVLHRIDPERAFRTVFAVAVSDFEHRFWVTCDLQEIIDQQNDAPLLMKLAMENQRLAELVARTVTAARPGFWPIAFTIVENYPYSANIQYALTAGIEQAEGHSSSYASRLLSSRQEVERVLNDPTTPSVARQWLQDVLSRLSGEIHQNIIWEYDENANDLRRYIEHEDKNSPERIWAIGRVLKYADWKDIKRMLTVEDIQQALDAVDLPDRKRKALEKALEVWQSGN
jgi:hypothetical protein